MPLFPYQREGGAHLLRAGRAILADDMGLGKTAQAIAACELPGARGEASRVLIVTLQILSRFAFVLTGTPVENRLDDLYSLMQIIDRNVFGPLWSSTFHQQGETSPR